MEQSATERTLIKLNARAKGYGSASSSPMHNFILHTVQPTDSLLGLSVQYNTKASQRKQAFSK